MVRYGNARFKLTLQPVSGKAIPVRRGEVMRIRQTLGEQCVDFNSFNIEDYKEYMDVSSGRTTTGFRPGKGNILFSNPPRFRPMIGILEMSPSCVTDILGRTCHATLFEARDGFVAHTCCQDTISEAIAEYGLTPDDVHHSFNMWMNTEWDSAGRYAIARNTGVPGDYVDLLACFDQLMVPLTCGSGDVQLTSNFSFKPIEIEVFEASAETSELVEKIIQRAGSFKNQQRTPDQYRVKDIKADRALRQVPGYEPKFVNYPIEIEDIEVPLNDAELAAANKLLDQGFGYDLGDVVRKGFMLWYAANRPAASRSWAKIPANWL